MPRTALPPSLAQRSALRLLLLSAAAAPALAQADYFEGFEDAGFVQPGDHGPDGLIAKGWDFRNQSDPVSSGDWKRWNYSYQGDDALNVNQSVSQWFNFNNATASSWAILPAIPNQVAGDELRFFVSSVIPSGYVPTDHLEVRYSPSGQTGTGTDADDVGDFTVLLLDIPDPQTHLWSEVVVPLPGDGRLALRFFIPPAPTEDDYKGGMQIDNLFVGTYDPGPPLPGPGETVHWTLAMSPVQIKTITTIVEGGTVIVDPGVVVDVHPTATLTVAGALIGLGQPGQPVTLQGGDRIEVFGSLELDLVSFGLRLHAMNASSLTLHDVSFLPGSALWTGGAPTYPSFIQVDQCSFSGAQMRVGGCILRLTNTTFAQSYCEIGGCNLFLENASFDGGTQAGLNLQFFLQPVWLNDLSITNSVEAGLDLVAVNALVGPDVTLAGNRYPADIGGSGFLPGSSLPAFGNANDYVNVEFKSAGLIGGNAWADVGIPYAIADFYSAGPLDLLPGVRVQLGPLAEFWGVNGRVAARGTPDAPVVFERLDPLQAWQGLQKFHRFENCIIDGGEVGARFNSITFPGVVDDCLIRNCDYGTQNDAIVRKTRFVNNAVGSWASNWPDALDGATGANSFEGNGLAVEWNSQLIDAPNNWWGHPTGPKSQDNPSGQGDAVSNGVTTVPFLTAAPDFDDHPPTVHLRRHDFLLEPGSKVILTWSSQDDEAVVSHRIEFDHPLAGAQTTIVADGLPGHQQAYEWTVPDIGFAVNGKKPRVRVVAIDTAGQEGWDASDHVIPSGEVGGTLTILTDLSGPYTAGAPATAPLCWDPSGLTGIIGSFVASLRLDADRTWQPLGETFSSCLPGSGMGIPFVSTDTARVAIAVQHTANRVKYFFSEPFAIRPDPRLGDAPPTVTMVTPLAGESFAGGTSIPISWVASDDEGLGGFHVQASYDAGHTWHFLAQDLPPDVFAHTFLLPASNGIPGLRLRVIAVDRRFQNSSDGGDRPLAILPGGELGTKYCTPAVPNSSGLSAVITASGSDVVADNSFHLTAAGMPSKQFGYFLAARQSAFVTGPGGSQGNLCLGGTIGRFSKDVLTTGAGGSYGLTIDLTSIPSLGAVQPGETWFFQSWFRDKNPLPTSNFTDGVEVAFK